MEVSYFRFKYNMDNSLINFVQSNISSYRLPYLVGYVNSGNIHNLYNMALYLVCHIDSSVNSRMVEYTEPLCIIARNDSEAIRYYYEVTGDSSGTSLCEITRNCKSLVIEPY